MRAGEFWTPEYWRHYCESANPFRQYKQERDRSLAIELLKPQDGELVLEVGCGYGRISRSLTACAKIRMVAIDESEAMIHEWKTAVFPGMACRGDATRLPFKSARFDAVVCTGVLMHLPDQRQALKELCRVLRPGGRLIISANNLLSPFALPVWCWMKLKSKVHQAYRSPWFYRRSLTQLGLDVTRMAGDTVLAVAPMPHGGRWVFSLARVLDRHIERPPLCYFAYEIWLLGVKA